MDSFVQTEPCLIYEPWRVRANEVSIALVLWATAGVIVSLALGSPWGYGTAVVSGVAAFISAWRALRVRLVVTEDGVVVDNYWVTHQFPWSEVEGVGIGLIGMLPRPALAFTRRDKRPVFAMATPLRRTERREFQAAVLAVGPPSVLALADRAGVIGADGALSNRLRLWWLRRRTS
jgi:hypothetical protein